MSKYLVSFAKNGFPSGFGGYRTFIGNKIVEAESMTESKLLELEKDIHDTDTRFKKDVLHVSIISVTKLDD
jgi:hypothetical protein